jgi:hypothetical protein
LRSAAESTAAAAPALRRVGPFFLDERPRGGALFLI